MGPSTTDAAVAWTVSACHAAFVAAVVATPFFGDRPALRCLSWAMPFLFVHWVTNNDTCCLTLVERRLRGEAAEAGFVERVISPVYKFQDGRASKRAVWWAAMALWLVAMGRLMCSGDP